MKTAKLDQHVNVFLIPKEPFVENHRGLTHNVESLHAYSTQDGIKRKQYINVSPIVVLCVWTVSPHPNVLMLGTLLYHHKLLKTTHGPIPAMIVIWNRMSNNFNDKVTFLKDPLTIF